MKKTLILLIMLTGAILLHAQVRRTPVQQRKAVQTSSGMYKGTLGHYELRGPVKTCKEIGDDWELNYFFEINGVISTINGESVSTSPRTYEFDTNGRIIRFFRIPVTNIFTKNMITTKLVGSLRPPLTMIIMQKT